MSRQSTSRSLAALGQTTESSRERLNKDDVNNPELIMAGLWADLNRAGLGDLGMLPVQLVAHRCTDKCRRGEHVYGKLNQGDVQIISAAVQWLASGAGRAFYEKFLRELGIKLVHEYDEELKQRNEREKKHGAK